jgi:prepilin-type N-terminal cleavage/methylation domain-containing protein
MNMSRAPRGIGLRSDASLRSFTLIELLVAMSVVALLMAILFQIFNQSTLAWASSERRVDAFREARAALFFMRRDLQNALVTNIAALAINEPSLQADPSLFFIFHQNSGGQNSTDKSDLCTVGYYAAYGASKSQVGVANSFKIHRYFRGSNQTYTNLLGYLLDPSSLKTIFPNPSANPQGGDEVLARNASQLQFRYLTNATSLFQTNAITFTNSRPLQIEISLEALNYDTANKLDTKTAWLNTNSTLYLKNVQRFSTRVTMRGGS